MKCVCPMGGDRTCPDDCPLAVWAGLSVADRKAQRKTVAERLYKQGFTMEQIATQLGVSQATISGVLSLSTIDKLEPRASKRGRKGEGRPKGSKQGPKPTQRKTTPAQDEQIAGAVLDGGRTYEQAQEEFEVSNTVVRRAVAQEQGRREALADPEINRDALSITAQQKLDAAIRQYQRKLDVTFEQRVQEEINQRLEHLILPVWQKKIADAKKIYDNRRSITNRETFNLIVKCLHTDTRKHLGDEVVNDAFVRFMALEKYLLNEKDSPTRFTGLPTTAAEWEQRKREATALRRVKRGHSNVGRSV
jgi:transposase